MNDLTVVMPQNTIGSFGKGIGKFTIINQELENHVGKVILDFSQCRILNPFILGGLASIIDSRLRKGQEFEFIFGDNYNIYSYLDTICFKGGCDPKNLPDIIKKLHYKTYIPVTIFPCGNSSEEEITRNHCLELIGNLIKTQLNLSETASSPIKYLISELTTNIHEHSKSHGGVIFAQHYNPPHLPSYLDVCICDTGIGILGSYFKNPKFHPEDEIEALSFAITGKSSKDRSESRGYGISTSCKLICKGLGGKIAIWSGRHGYFQTSEISNILPVLSNFSGTYIALRIPTTIPVGLVMADYYD